MDEDLRCARAYIWSRIQQLKLASRLQAAFGKALREFFPRLKTGDDKTDFFAVYQKEADEYDRDFTKKYDEDLNTTLIFVRNVLETLDHRNSFIARRVYFPRSPPHLSSMHRPTYSQISHKRTSTSSAFSSIRLTAPRSPA